MKTERVDNVKFCISSVQDDQSKIILSSGIISVNQLQRQENCEDKGGTITLDRFSFHLSLVPSLAPLHQTLLTLG